jgi:CheY-like chemotaxis protein
VHFLCIDDEPLNLQVLSDMLHVAGATADACTSGAAGIAALSTGSYDLILVDLRMPGMDGISFIEQVRGQSEGRQSIPIVVVTAERSESRIEQCRSAGADDVLGKPVIMETLYECIADVLSRRGTSVTLN